MAYVEAIRTAGGERFRAGFRVNGRKYSKVFDYRYEAETWGTVEETKAKAAVAALTAGDTTPATPTTTAPVAAPGTPAPTLLAHATDWIERRSGALARATLNNYRHHARALTIEGLADRGMDTIARSDIQRWQTAAAKVKGPVVLNQRLKFIRSIYRDAMAEYPGVVNHDPTHGVRMLAVADLPDRNLTDDEATALLAAATDPATRLPILVALDTGLRWSEVFGLTPAAILSDRFLSVHQVIERDAARVRQYTKGHSRRQVPMPPRLSAELVAYAEAVAKFRGRDALLFPGANGGPMVYWTWTRTKYGPAVAASGIVPAGFHTLRHTYGSKLAAAGVPRLEIAKVMGHADEETTRRYMHAGDDGRRYDLVAAALAG